MRGLIIRSPHIDNILARKKIWEMRSKTISLRETIALIKAGTGTVVGIADVTDCLGPLSIQERLDTELFHCVQAETWQEPQFQKYEYAWVLSNVRSLAQPVRYLHPMGAQGFVIIDDNTELKILAEASMTMPSTPRNDPEVCLPATGKKTNYLLLSPGEHQSINVEDIRPTVHPAAAEITISWAPQREEPRVISEQATAIKRTVIQHQPRLCKGTAQDPLTGRGIQVPFAADGTCFHPMLRRPRVGTYVVGDKDSEVTFDAFEAALNYLSEMSVAKWRRPNDKGNWGIVSAVRWADLPQYLYVR